MFRAKGTTLISMIFAALILASCGSSAETNDKIIGLEEEVIGLEEEIVVLSESLSESDSINSQQGQKIDDLSSKLESQESTGLEQDLIYLATEVAALNEIYTNLSTSLSQVPADRWLDRHLALTRTSTENLADYLVGQDLIERAVTDSGLPVNPNFSTIELKEQLDRAATNLQIISTNLEEELRARVSTGYDGFTRYLTCRDPSRSDAEYCTYFEVESISDSLLPSPINEGDAIQVVLETHALLNKLNLAFDTLLN